MIVFDGAGVTAADGTTLLADVSLNLGERRVAIIGRNGSGKTTLARLVNGLDRVTSGNVSVDGIDPATDRRAVQRRVGFVFHDADHQLVYPTPREDVALGLRARGASRRDAEAAAMAGLRELGLELKADQAIHTLSGGEKHLVALCAVLVLEPAWIVLDEPTTSLDLINRNRLVEVLERLAHRLVIVTHDLDLAATCDRTVLLDGGRAVADGRSADVVARYRDLVAAA